jgi:hypothetical protein
VFTVPGVYEVFLVSGSRPLGDSSLYTTAGKVSLKEIYKGMIYRKRDKPPNDDEYLRALCKRRVTYEDFSKILLLRYPKKSIDIGDEKWAPIVNYVIHRSGREPPKDLLEEFAVTFPSPMIGFESDTPKSRPFPIYDNNNAKSFSLYSAYRYADEPSVRKEKQWTIEDKKKLWSYRLSCFKIFSGGTTMTLWTDVPAPNQHGK